MGMERVLCVVHARRTCSFLMRLYDWRWSRSTVLPFSPSTPEVHYQ